MVNDYFDAVLFFLLMQYCLIAGLMQRIFNCDKIQDSNLTADNIGILKPSSSFSSLDFPIFSCFVPLSAVSCLDDPEEFTLIGTL